jgi:dCMP deaminase
MIEERFMQEAENAALNSPCIRRKYGAVITGDNGFGTIMCSVGWNVRMGRCCSNDICIRDINNTGHAQGIEKGGEIHAEMAALVSDKDYAIKSFYLAGFDRNSKPLLGKSCRPCHMCAMMMKFAGFKYVIIRNTQKELEPISVDEIIEEHELSYGSL